MSRTTLSRTTFFLNVIHPVFIQDQPVSATCQAILSSVILAQCEGKKFPGEVGDILEGPGYKVHLECPVQHEIRCPVQHHDLFASFR